MNWHSYYYLAAAALAAFLILAITTKLMPQLTKRSPRRTKEELALLGTIVGLGLLVIYWHFYTERLRFAFAIGDIGCDTIEQYVPFYCNLIGNIRDGSLSLWSFEYELGVSLPSYQSWIYDPFNLIIVPLGLLLGDTHISLVLVITQSVKLILSAYLFDHFLTRFCETPLARLMGALLFAFSGFMIMYGQHYWFGGAFPLFAFTMLMFELYLERQSMPRFLGVVIACAIQVAWSVYVAFMILLFAALYLLIRIPHFLERVTPKSYLGTIFKMALPVVCGALLAGITFIPYVSFLLTETSRTSSDASMAERVTSKLLSFDPVDWIPAILSRSIGSGLISTGQDAVYGVVSGIPDIDFTYSFPYEFILLGYSAGFFILLGQFYHWLFADCGKRDRNLVMIGTVFVLLYCFHQFLPTLFTAMVRLQFRSSFTIALPACTAMALGLEKRIMAGKVAKAPLAVSSVLTLAILIWSLLNTANGRLVCLYYLAVTVFVIILLALVARSRVAQPVLLTLIVGAMVSTSVVDGFFDTNSRKTVDGAAFPLSSVTNDGVAANNDAQTKAALEFLAEYDTTFYRVDKTYSDWCPLNDSLIQHFAGASAYNSTPDADVDDFYEKLWKESISTWAVYSQGFKNNPDRPEILALLNVKYILTQGPVDYDWCSYVAEFGDVYVYRNDRASSIATIRTGVVSESEADALPNAESRRQLLESSVIVPDDVTSELSASLTESQDSSASSQFTKIDETHLEGTASCTTNSIACLAVPNTGTWEITVDGESVETFRADYGFIGFTLPAGEHTITATYHLAGLKQGILATAIGAALTAVSALFVRSKERAQAS